MRPIIHMLKHMIGPLNPLRILYHRARALKAAWHEGFPARGLTVIGITGTDGKTTTVGMTAHILAAQGIPVAALSTAFVKVREEFTWNDTQKTSPGPAFIQKFLRRAKAAGCTHVILECSSHGLVQGRLDWTSPSVAAITNVSEEHLDYHGTMQAYINAKALLFRKLRGRGVKVLHEGDRSMETLATIPSGRTFVFGNSTTCMVRGFAPHHDTSIPLPSTLLSSSNERAEGNLITAKIHEGTKDYHLEMPLSGLFNIENALAALSIAMSCNVKLEDGIGALKTFTGVRGRMEPIREGQPFSVFIDFTVTPQAYERTLTTIRNTVPLGNRLLVLCGSCGDRMREKRPLVGKIVSDHAHVTVVTNEDPYTEDPEKIIDEVVAGVDQSKTELHRISDRGEALKVILAEAAPGDTVLLCGKGADTTMWVKDGQIPWDERAIVQSMLRERYGDH